MAGIIILKVEIEIRRWCEWFSPDMLQSK